MHELQWTYEVVNAEVYAFVRMYIAGKPRKAVFASDHCGFETSRLLALDDDPHNGRTKAAMMDSLTGLIRAGSSKTARELKTRLFDLALMVNKYRERTGEEPNKALLASVLSNRWDSETRRTFAHSGMLGDDLRTKESTPANATEEDFTGN